MTFVAKRKTPGEKALSIMTEMHAMMRDMHSEVMRLAEEERKAAVKKGAHVQPEPPAKDDREFDDE